MLTIALPAPAGHADCSTLRVAGDCALGYLPPSSRAVAQPWARSAGATAELSRIKSCRIIHHQLVRFYRCGELLPKEFQGRGRCPSAVDYDGADWRFSFETHPLTAALAITNDLSNADVTRILRRLAATLGVANAKTPSFNAMRAVLTQLSSPHTYSTSKEAYLAWGATPSNFRTWKKGILTLHASLMAAQSTAPLPQPLSAESTVPALSPPQPLLAEPQPSLVGPMLPALLLPQSFLAEPPPSSFIPPPMFPPLARMPQLLQSQPGLALDTEPQTFLVEPMPTALLPPQSFLAEPPPSPSIPSPMFAPLALMPQLLQSQPDLAIDTVQIEEFEFRSQSLVAREWALKRKIHQCADILTEMLVCRHIRPPNTKVDQRADTPARWV
jgi:hypothetical protein